MVKLYPRGHELLYTEYPIYYTFAQSFKRNGKRRKSPKKSQTIGRIYMANPKRRRQDIF